MYTYACVYTHWDLHSRAARDFLTPVLMQICTYIHEYMRIIYTSICMHVHMRICIHMCVCIYIEIYRDYIYKRDLCSRREDKRWGAGVETQKNVWGEIGGWGRVPFNEPYAPSLSTIYDGA